MVTRGHFFIGLLVRAMPNTARPGRATCGMTHWVAVMLTVNLIVVAGIWLVADPAQYRFDCEYRYLPSVQQTFGFQGGRFNDRSHDFEPYVLLRVDPAGSLGPVGFREGDAPVAHHGGLVDFCDALQQAERGVESQVHVVNLYDLAGGRRVLKVLPPSRDERGR